MHISADMPKIRSCRGSDTTLLSELDTIGVLWEIDDGTTKRGKAAVKTIMLFEDMKDDSGQQVLANAVLHYESLKLDNKVYEASEDEVQFLSGHSVRVKEEDIYVNSNPCLEWRVFVDKFSGRAHEQRSLSSDSECDCGSQGLKRRKLI